MSNPLYHPDSDEHKGATEQEDPRSSLNQSSLAGQLGHRSSDPAIKQSDTDFPGPDAMEEHTGEQQ